MTEVWFVYDPKVEIYWWTTSHSHLYYARDYGWTAQQAWPLFSVDAWEGRINGRFFRVTGLTVLNRQPDDWGFLETSDNVETLQPAIGVTLQDLIDQDGE